MKSVYKILLSNDPESSMIYVSAGSMIDAITQAEQLGITDISSVKKMSESFTFITDDTVYSYNQDIKPLFD